MNSSFWDQRYAEEKHAYGTEPNDFLREVAPQLPVGDALCLAEGQGRNAVFLAQRGCRVTAMDLSPVGLQRAQQLATERGVTLTTLVADLDTWAPAPASADVIVSIWGHLPPALRRRVHRDLCTWLRPGGAVVLESYGPGQLAYSTGGPRELAMLPSLEELREDFGTLDLRIAREVTRTVHEGPYHDGMSATVQVLGFRR